MVKFDYFNWVGMERKCDCYSIFERQHDVTGQGLGFGSKKKSICENQKRKILSSVYVL